MAKRALQQTALDAQIKRINVLLFHLQYLQWQTDDAQMWIELIEMLWQLQRPQRTAV